MTTYRLCLLGPTNKIAAVWSFWASTDEGAIATAPEMLADNPTLIGFEIWDGPRNVAEERKRAGVTRSRAPSKRRER